jgi:hypothetical protein
MAEADQPSNIVSFPHAQSRGGVRPSFERAVQEPSGKIWVLVDAATWERLLQATRALS